MMRTKIVSGAVLLALGAGLTACNKADDLLDSMSEETGWTGIVDDTGESVKATHVVPISESGSDGGYAGLILPSGDVMTSDVLSSGARGEVIQVTPGTSTGEGGAFQEADYLSVITGHEPDAYFGISMRLSGDGDVLHVGAEGRIAGSWSGISYYQDVTTFNSGLGLVDASTVFTDGTFSGENLGANSFCCKPFDGTDVTGDGYPDIILTSTGQGDAYVFEGDGSAWSGTYLAEDAPRSVNLVSNGYPGWSTGVSTDSLIGFGDYRHDGQSGYVSFYGIPLADGDSELASYEAAPDDPSGLRIGQSVLATSTDVGADLVIGVMGGSGLVLIETGSTPNVRQQVLSPDTNGDGSADADGNGSSLANCIDNAGNKLLISGARGMVNSKGEEVGGAWVYVQDPGGGLMDYVPDDDTAITPLLQLVGPDGETDAGVSVDCGIGPNGDTLFYVGHGSPSSGPSSFGFVLYSKDMGTITDIY